MIVHLGPAVTTKEHIKPPENVEPQYVKGAHFHVCLWLDNAFKWPVDPTVTAKDIGRLVEIRNFLSDIPGITSAQAFGRMIIESRIKGDIANKASLSNAEKKRVLGIQQSIVEQIYDRGYVVYDRNLHNLIYNNGAVTMIDFYDIYSRGHKTRAWQEA